MTAIKQMLAEALVKLEEAHIGGEEFEAAHSLTHHFPKGSSRKESNYKYHVDVGHSEGDVYRYHTNSHDLAQKIHDTYKHSTGSSMHRKYTDGHVARIDDERHLEEGATTDIKKWQHGNRTGSDHAAAGHDRNSPFEHGSSEDKGYHDGYNERKHGKDRESHEYNRDLALRSRNGQVGSGMRFRG